MTTFNDLERQIRPILKSPEIISLLDRFAELNGYYVWIRTPEDDPGAGCGKDFCSRFPVLSALKNDSDFGNVPDNCTKEPCTYILNHALGLHEGRAPLVFRNIHVANIHAGQIFFTQEDKDAFAEQGTNRGFAREILSKYSEIPIVAQENFLKGMKFLEEMVNSVLALLFSREEEKRLKAEKERLIEIMEVTSDLVSTATPEGTLTYLNRGGCILAGWDVKTPLTGKQIPDLHPDWALQKIKDKGIPAAIENGIWSGETAILDVCGKEIPVSQVIIGHKDSSGKLQYLSTIMRDISRQKRDENALRQSEKQFRLLAENASDMIFTCGAEEEDFLFHFVNPACFTLFGFSQKEMIQLSMKERIPEKFHPIIKETARDILERDCTGRFYMQHYHKDGHLVDCEVFARRLPTDPGCPVEFQGRITDITERLKIESALRDSEERFSQFMNFVPASVFIKDTDGKLVYTNRFFDEAFQSSDNAGKTAYDFFDPEIADRMIEEDRRTLAGEIVSGEKKVPHADGSINSYQTYEFLIDREGKSPLLGGVSINITETIKMQERLRRSERMESIGSLAGGIAHDFNNILTGILNAAQLIEITANTPEKGLFKYIAMIIKAARQAADLTSQLLLFSRQSRMQGVEMDIHIAIDDALDMLKTMLNRNIRYNLELNAVRHTILADRSRMQNILINLGVNASQAMPEGGEITIRTENKNLSEEYCTDSPFDIAAGDYLCLRFQDTGCGISGEELSRIFDPFFTTKEIGTGLGLSTVYGIIREYRGEISVNSIMGSGTTFTILLPLAVGNGDIEKRCTNAVRGSGTILIVDDEELIRHTAVRMVESLGYTVLEASGGREALDIYKMNSERVDLVILDMIMPEMDGSEVFRELRKIDPECRIAVSSGYSTGEELERMTGEGGCALIPKPYHYQELSRKLKALLS